MLCYKTAANQMLKQQAKDKDHKAHYRIIGGSSIAGVTGFPLSSGYTATKFTIGGLTQAAAGEFGRFGITVNAYAPGFIGGSEMVDKFIDTVTDIRQIPVSEGNDETVGNTQTKVLGETRHVATIVSYIASQDADWTTSQTIVVDGGTVLA